MKHKAPALQFIWSEPEAFKLMVEDTQDTRAMLEQKRQAERHAKAQARKQDNLPGYWDCCSD